MHVCTLCITFLLFYCLTMSRVSEGFKRLVIAYGKSSNIEKKKRSYYTHAYLYIFLYYMNDSNFNSESLEIIKYIERLNN